MTGFIFGQGTDISDPKELARRRAIVDAMMAQQAQQGAPRNLGEGIFSAGNSIANALTDRNLKRKEDKARADVANEIPDIAKLIMGGQPYGGASAPAVSAQPIARTPDTAGGIADDTMRALGKTPMGPYRDAIASIESAGSGDYSAIGPTNERLGRALGRYQIMEANIGPWSREVLGREVTPDEFLANPQIQDAIFDGKFGGYVEKFGPEGAAQAWFAGPGGVGKMNRQDVLGTSVADYTQKFSAALGGQPSAQPAQPNAGTRTFNPEIINQLAALSSNPYASEGQRQIAALLMDQQIKQMMPQRKDPIEVGGVLLDPNNGYQQIFDSRKPDKPEAAPSKVREYRFYEEQALARGEQPMTYEEFITIEPRAGNPAGMPGPGTDEEKLREKLGGREGEIWGGYLDQAGVAAGMQQDMELLNEIITLAPQGPLSGRLAGAFPGVNSAADAFNSIVKRVAPTLRAEGSGATSDIEYDGMLRSLPQLANRPEANRAIAAMMQAKARINQDRGAIVSRYSNGEITAQEARSQLNDLNTRSILTPELKGLISGLAPADASTAEAPPDYLNEQDAELWEFYTPEERAAILGSYGK